MEFERFKTPEFPEYIIVETSSRCNLRCIMCEREHTGRPAGDMSFDTFKKIADEASKYSGTKLSLQFLGEPLLNRQIITMITYAKEIGISFVSLTTNGMLLDRADLAKRLVSSGIDEINISVDGASQNIFERIRPGVNADRVDENIRLLLAARTGSKPQINLSFLRLTENKEEEEKFVRKWIGVVDNITFKAGLDNDRRVIRRELVDFSRPRIPCAELWLVIVVYNTGDVGICCEDLYNSAIKANINGSSLGDIWRSSQYEKIRQNQISGSYNVPAMCEKCEYWRRQSTESARNEIYENVSRNEATKLNPLWSIQI